MANFNNILTQLKVGINIFRIREWQQTGRIKLSQKESHFLHSIKLETNQCETNIWKTNPNIILSHNIEDEPTLIEYVSWLEENQWKIFPLLKVILEASLIEPQIIYHHYHYRLMIDKLLVEFIRIENPQSND